MSHRPTSIPLPTHSDPTATSPIPPTPSAFPSLSGDSPSTHSHSTAPQSTLHYAQVTGKVLPPTSIPKGVSLPPPPHQVQSTTSTSKERIQSSGQKNRDSPYARPGQGQRSHSGGQTGGGGTGSTAQQRRKSTKPTNGQPSSANPKSAPTTVEKTPEDKHRNIPGMPSTWTAKNPKKPSPRRKSEGTPPAMDKDGVHLPGKKKIRTLKKVLPPANSKLSALAPTFEFVPRSATSPNLSAAAASQGESSSGSGSEESGEDQHEEETEQDHDEETSPPTTVTDSSSLGSFLTSSFSLSDPKSLAPVDSHQDDEEEAKDPAEGLVDEKLAAEIVSSSGPQADGFVGQTLTQSESGMRPDTDKTGFRSIPGVVNESPMADLEWKEKMGWWREDFAPDVKVTKEEEGNGQEEEKEEKEVKLAPAAIEANSHETPLLQFPPWKPSESSTSSTQAEDIDLSESNVSPSILSKVLPDSFSDPPPVASTSTSSSSNTSSTSDSPSSSAEPTSTPSLSSFLPTSFTPPLSGYTSTSSSFLSQDELKAEKLSADGPNGGSSDEMPLSAEAVASQPTLDDALDVDEVKVGGSEKSQATGGKEKEVRKGWWNSSEGENETEKPQPNQAEHSDSMVDPDLAKETVESVPAQADGFVAKGFSEVDQVGEEAREGEKEVKKDVEQNTREGESHQDVVEAEPENVKQETETREEETETSEGEEEGKGSSTPLGSFLSSAFQPTDNSFSSSSHKVTQDEAAEPATDSTPVPSSSSKPAPPARRSSSPPPPERRPSQSHAADSAPSLTLAISSAWHTAPWSRKIWAIIASVAINVGLPFVNGVMLGFGELFARNVLGVRFGWPLHNNTPTTGSSSSRANTGGVGLRAAGNTSNANSGRGIGTDVPGHAGAKTALEGVVESVAE